MYALIDCNNFYASCERLFRPDLINKPVVVLSNNDGCAIARSNEAKALGIKMGDPYFQIKSLCKRNGVHIFSSNYTLYGDISHRVMSIIEESWNEDALEIYSIDEAFLDLKTLPEEQINTFCTNLRAKILKDVGIPTSVGIGKTKTLAKLANHIAKKCLKIPVFDITGHEYWLKHIEVNDIWGVGRQLSKRLNRQGVKTAYDLAQLNTHIVRKQYNVLLMRSVMELNGCDCIGLDDYAPKQSIMSAKSFGSMQTELWALEQALSSYVARVCEKMRQQNSKASCIQVFVLSNRFRQDLPQYSNAVNYKLVHPTDDVRALTSIAKRCLKKIFREGIHYKKVGFGVLEMVDKAHQQLDLLHTVNEDLLQKSNKIMSMIDGINKRFGKRSVHLLAEGFNRHWKLRAELQSPAYTTEWLELPMVYAR